MQTRLHLSWLAAFALGVSGVAVAATDATPHEIYEAAQSGHLAQAQQMINQVLQDHPQNALAHYVAAQLDARIGDLTAGREQLAEARRLDPTLSFARAQSVNALQRELTGLSGVAPRAVVSVPHRSAAPWILILVLALGGFVIISVLRSRSQRYSQGFGPGLLPPGGPGLQGGYGYPPGYPPPGGSGLMGNLASGLAIGAGVAAGEELVRHVIDGHSGTPVPGTEYRDGPRDADMGGADFGTQDGSSWGNDSGGDAGGWGGDGGGGGGGDWS